MKSEARRTAFLSRSLNRRTASFIETHLEQLKSESEYLQSHDSRESVIACSQDELLRDERLGQGSFADVFSLSQYPESIDVMSRSSSLVVKQLRSDIKSNRQSFENAISDLVSEGQFLSRLDHPNIIKLHGWARDFDEDYFLVLEQVDCTLEDKIQEWKDETNDNDRISHLRTKLRYAQELASALSYLHSNRLIFRDLKPKNIGILNDSIVLFDFGLCRELPGNAQSSDDMYIMSGVGTLPYMAPETVMSKSYNQSADCYSFSIIVFELLFHQKPFDMYSVDMHRLLVCQEGQRPEIPDFCPLDLEEIMEAGWSSNPLERLNMDSIERRLSMATPTGLSILLEISQTFIRKSFGSFSERTTMTACTSFGSFDSENVE